MGVDVARGLAVLGMLWAHVGTGAGSFDWTRPETWGDVANGRSSVLFGVVAGVSLALMTRAVDRHDPNAVRAARLRLVGRGLTVFAIGIALELLHTTIGVILPVYGALFVIAAPLLSWRTRSLLIGASVCAVVVPVGLGLLTALSAGGEFGAGVTFALLNSFPLPVWITFLLIGLAVGRLPLQRIRVQAGLLVVGALLALVGYGLAAVAAPLTAPGDSSPGGSASASSTPNSASASESPGDSPDGSGGPALAPADQFDFTGLSCTSNNGVIACASPERFASLDESDPGADDDAAATPPLTASGVVSQTARHWLDASAHSGGALEIIGAGGAAMIVLALALLLSRPLRWVLVPVAALGSMPLTAYAAHVLLFTGDWFPMSDPIAAWVIASLGLLTLTTVWAVLVGRGPLEVLIARGGSAFAGRARVEA